MRIDFQLMQPHLRLPVFQLRPHLVGLRLAIGNGIFSDSPRPYPARSSSRAGSASRRILHYCWFETAAVLSLD